MQEQLQFGNRLCLLCRATAGFWLYVGMALMGRILDSLSPFIISISILIRI